MAKLPASRLTQLDSPVWNAEHPERPDPEVFRREVLPAIQTLTLRELARRTGLSVAYCGLIRRGAEVPHARWWVRLVSQEP